jgi:putative glutamine amidotransferase
MQLPLFKKNILTYPCSGLSEARDIFKLFNAKLEAVDDTERARRSRYDGVLLLGGVDISPFWYGEASTHSRPPQKDRDVVEWTLARRALADGKPIMGICRGHQMLAVAAGGSLYQDIYRQKVTKQHPGYHPITAKDPLCRYLPEQRVNSRHHQAVKVVPYGWKVLANSPDGIIEAIWRPGALGVQWHPEDLFYQNHRWHGLFGWFIEGLRG